MTSHVDFSGREHAWLLPLPLSTLRQTLCAMLEKGGLAPACVDVLLVRDEDMCWYNRQYMGCTGPTNILSFPDTAASPDQTFFTQSPSPLPLPRPLGSLILSVDTMNREALLYRQERKSYCLRLFAHGLGHLAGYEHGPRMDNLCTTMR